MEVNEGKTFGPRKRGVIKLKFGAKRFDNVQREKERKTRNGDELGPEASAHGAPDLTTMPRDSPHMAFCINIRK